MTEVTVPFDQRDWVINQLNVGIEESIKFNEERYQQALQSYREQRWLVRILFDPPPKYLFQGDVWRMRELLETFKTQNWETITLNEWDWRLITG